MNRIRYHRLAVRELHVAVTRCDRDRPGSGLRLLDAVNGTAGRIARVPHKGSPYLHGTRRFVLQRFPYSNVYLPLDRLGHIIAIAYHRRRPGYWRKRLKDVR